MLKFRSPRLALLLVLFVFSCGKDLPTLQGIDTETWKSDRNGCEGKRFQMTNAMRVEKDKLLALDEKEVIAVLGRPDRNELYKRNQKFYYYFLQPAPECKLGNEKPLRLVLRFNAMGLAKEVVVE
ncbi:MAG TPA: hypothetical protein VGD65_13970 [Chryseosolibacter sp.]